MYNTFAAICALFSSSVLIIYTDRLIARAEWLSERNRLRRREFYREREYAKKREEYAIKRNRQDLWRSVGK